MSGGDESRASGRFAAGAAAAPGTAAVPRCSGYLPLAIDMTGLSCLVVGGGRIGTRKALKLARAGARVTVLAPEVSPRLAGAAERGELVWIEERYSPRRLAGSLLVVAATDSARLNLAIRGDCEARGILSCAVSPGRGSRVLFPAVHRTEHLTVAVHSDGRDCAASRLARDRLARVLEAAPRPERQFCVFGTARGRVREDVFAGLDPAGARLQAVLPSGRDFAQAMLLRTCQRWEIWFLATSPEAGARELRGMIHSECGLLPEEHGKAFALLSGPAARQHALRVACGLESPIPGETEIVGQIRRARDRHLPDPGSDLRRIVDDILVDQRSVRRESRLRPVAGGWAGRTASLVRAAVRERPAVVLLLGMGQLGTKLLRALRSDGHEVLAVSEHSGGSGADTHAPDRLSELIGRAQLAIVTSAGEDQRRLLERARRGGRLALLDLSSAGCLGSLPAVSLDGADAAAISLARSLIFERAIDRAACPPRAGRLRIGARGSQLSLRQVSEAKRVLAKVLPLTDFAVEAIDTPGDRDRVTPLPEATAGDFFTRDLDEALLDRRIDLAVHSAKDLPADLVDGLTVAALLPAFAPWECLVSAGRLALPALPPGARVGTSSVRRREWLMARRPDVTALDIRGNVPDRLAQLDAGRFDALLLAAAGVIRLGLQDRIAQVFSEEECPPPPGQGSLAFVARSADRDLCGALAPLDLGSREGTPWAR